MTSARRFRQGSTRVRLWIVLGAVLAFATGTAAFADDITTGTIRVAVRGAGVGALSIDIAESASPSLPPATRHWRATVDATHAVTFHRLPPATYAVVVQTASGSVADATIAIGVGSVISLEVTAPVTGDPLAISVVEATHAGQGVDFPTAAIDALPAGSDLWALLDGAVPYVIVDRLDGGGLGVARTSPFSTRGASWTLARLHIDQLDLGAPVSAGAMLVPNLPDVDGLRVYLGQMPPEVGTPGPVVAFAPRRAGPRPSFLLDGAVSSPGMVAHNETTAAPSIGRVDTWRDVDVQTGVPLASRASLFASASDTDAMLQERADPALAHASNASLFAHLVTVPTDRDEFRFVTSGARREHPFDDRRQFSDTSLQERDMASQAQATWDHTSGGGSLQEWSVGYTRADVTPSVGSGNGGTIDRVFDGPVPPPASAVVHERLQAQVAFEPREIRGLGALRFSASFIRQSSAGHVLALPTVAELVDGLAARVWVPTAPARDSARHVDTGVVTIADEMRVHNRLTLEVGVRADVSRGSADAGDAATWRTVAPRVSVRWATSHATLFGGGATYYPELTTNLLAFGDPGEPAIDVYRWTDANGNRRFDDGEQGALISPAGRNPGIARIDPSLRPPRTEELTFGSDFRVASRNRLSVTAVIRNEHDLIGLTDPGAPLSSYSVLTVPNQDETPGATGTINIYDRLPSTFDEDRYLLTNISGHRVRYRGLEATWDMRTPHWYVLAGANMFLWEGPNANTGFRADENDAGVIGMRFADPNAGLVKDGSLFFDRSYILKWSTAFHARGFLAAATARYQDGQPFARLIVEPDLAQGPEAISADEIGTTRFSFEATIDARLEQRISLGGHRSLTIRLDAFNLTNRANEIEENPVAGPEFRQTTAVQPPRTLRIGINVRF